MTPVLLIMQAFGPYAETETIDFRAAVTEGLFGIYGPTGSGKSSIFNAICFALFGERTGADAKETEALRSDHADMALMTEVTFLFDLGQKRYLVRRLPKQPRPKKRGGGVTESDPEAYLFDATGLSIEAVLQGETGKVLAERKAKTLVDPKIVDLLGYKADQFRQIGLLPQGRFETFLNSDTASRTAILRDLFDVSIFLQLQDGIKAKAFEADRLYKEQRAVLDHKLKDADFESLDQLGLAISEAAQACGEKKAAEVAMLKAVDEALAEEKRAQALDQHFANKVAAEAKLKALKAEAGEQARIAADIELARSAQQFDDLDRAVAEAQNDLIAARTALEAKIRAQAAAETSKATADAAWAREEAESDVLKGLERDFLMAQKHHEALKGAGKVRQALRDANERKRLAHQQEDQARTHHAGCLEATTRAAESLEKERHAQAERKELELHLKELTLQRTEINTYQKAEQQLNEATQNSAQAHKTYTDAETTHQKAKAALDQAESAIRYSHAQALALTLEPNTPCPVCGSLDHPQPASGEAGVVGSDLDLKALRDGVTTSEQNLRTADGAIQAGEAIVKERQEHLGSLTRPDRDPKAVEADLVAANEKREALGPSRDLEALEAHLHSLKDSLKKADDAVTAQLALKTQADTAAMSEKARLDAILDTLPSDQQEDAASSAKVKRLERDFTVRSERRQRADQIRQETALEVQLATKDVDAGKARLTEAEERLRASQSRFAERLADAGLDHTSYQHRKALLGTLEDNLRRVQLHQEARAIATESLTQAAQSIGEEGRPDLLKVEHHVSSKRDAATEATAARVIAEQQHTQLTELRSSLQEAQKRLEELDAETGPLRGLADLVSSKNAFKMDLETFALMTMFEAVVEAANLRLSPMTNGRYFLQRGQERDGNKRVGLDLLVFDVFTGSARKTSTLSGGETFIAALALALGLADVVEAASGKVRLETIFIDEGFGSLDTEDGAGTLNQVLTALQALVSQNRAVGLISHVPLVQEAVPNGFYVRKGVAGSHIERRYFGLESAP